MATSRRLCTFVRYSQGAGKLPKLCFLAWVFLFGFWVRQTTVYYILSQRQNAATPGEFSSFSYWICFVYGPKSYLQSRRERESKRVRKRDASFTCHTPLCNPTSCDTVFRFPSAGYIKISSRTVLFLCPSPFLRSAITFFNVLQFTAAASCSASSYCLAPPSPFPRHIHHPAEPSLWAGLTKVVRSQLT